MSKTLSLKKLTILGDSLALPRPEDGIVVDDIYSTKLAALPDMIVFNKAKISADTSLFLEAEQLYYDIYYSNSEYFILHLGICDCSPRLFTKKEKKFLSALIEIPMFTKRVNTYINNKSKERLYHTKNRMIQNVPINDFKKNYIRIIEEIKKSNPVKKIFLINIAVPGEGLIKKSYNIQHLVDNYNKIIHEISIQYNSITKLIDVNTFTSKDSNFILKDGHHINKKVHKFIYDIVANSCSG